MHSVIEQTKVEAETSRYVARNKMLVVIKEVKGGRGRGFFLVMFTPGFHQCEVAGLGVVPSLNAFGISVDGVS